MDLVDLLNALIADLGYLQNDLTGQVATRLTRYVNEGYRHILTMSEFAPLRSQTLPFTSEANRKVYGFPSAFVQIDQIVDTTNSIRLRLLTADQFRVIDPQETASGTPTHYVPLGYGPLSRDIPVPSPLYVVTTNLLVTESFDITAIRSGGYQTPFLSVALSGTTRVQAGTFSDFIAVSRFQLSTNLVTGGPVQLWDAAVGGNLLSSIPPGFPTVQYQQIRLWPTPSDAYQYQIDGTAVITELRPVSSSTFNDIPLLPEDFHTILADYARMREYEFRDDSRAALAMAQYQAKLKMMRDRIMDPPDYRPRVGRIPDRTSNLGPWFPTGRW